MTNPDFLKCECRLCAGHIEFPAEAAGQTLPCPHCGRPTTLPGGVIESKKQTHTPLILGSIALLIIVAAAVFIFLKKPAPQSNPAPLSQPAISPATNQPVAQKRPDGATTNDFAISAIKLEKTPGSSLVYATGKLQNLSDKQRYGVKLQLQLLDANGAPVGKATDFHQNMDPHGDWNFKAMVLTSKAVSATLIAVLEDQ